jgi:hypothetical protein
VRVFRNAVSASFFKIVAKSCTPNRSYEKKVYCVRINAHAVSTWLLYVLEVSVSCKKLLSPGEKPHEKRSLTVGDLSGFTGLSGAKLRAAIDKALPHVERAGGEHGYRLVNPDDLPLLMQELIKRGWLREQEPVGSR